MREVAEAMVEAGKMLEQRRIMTARALYQTALKEHPASAAVVAYNRGALEFWFAGDGRSAREWFVRSLDEASAGCPGVSGDSADELHANTLENLMLLALSYEEYEQFAEQLRALQPGNEILRDHLPKIRKMRDAGEPWSTAMQWMAFTHLRHAGKRDPARYGAAAATAQLMLANRGQLRLSRDRHREVVLLLAGSRMHCVSYADLIMRRTTQRSEPREFISLAEEAIPYVQEYLNANPDDTEVADTLSKLQQTVEDGLHGVVSPAQPGGGSRAVPYIIALIGCVIGALLAVRIPGFASPWNGILGAAAGVVLGGVVGRRVAGPSSSRRKGRREGPWQTTRALRKSIRKSGVAGLEFELTDIAVRQGALLLTFEPKQAVDESQRSDVSLALRAVVWQTIPTMAPLCHRLEIGTSRQKARVDLGAGVPVQYIGLRSGWTESPALECDSWADDGQFRVSLAPISPAVMSLQSVSGSRGMKAEGELNDLFGKLAEGFRSLEEPCLILEG